MLLEITQQRWRLLYEFSILQDTRRCLIKMLPYKFAPLVYKQSHVLFWNTLFKVLDKKKRYFSLLLVDCKFIGEHYPATTSGSRSYIILSFLLWSGFHSISFWKGKFPQLNSDTWRIANIICKDGRRRRQFLHELLGFYRHNLYRRILLLFFWSTFRTCWQPCQLL